MRFCSYCRKTLPDTFVEEIPGAGGYGIFSEPGQSSSLVACRHCLYGDEYPQADAYRAELPQEVRNVTLDENDDRESLSEGPGRKWIRPLLMLGATLLALGAWFVFHR